MREVSLQVAFSIASNVIRRLLGREWMLDRKVDPKSWYLMHGAIGNL